MAPIEIKKKPTELGGYGLQRSCNVLSLSLSTITAAAVTTKSPQNELLESHFVFTRKQGAGSKLTGPNFKGLLTEAGKKRLQQ